MASINRFYFLVFVAFNLSGCSRDTMAVKRSKLALETALNSQEATLKMLDKMAEQAQQAAASGKIAELANEEIQAYVATEQVAVETTRRQLQGALNETEEYKTGKSKKSHKQVLIAANSAVINASEQIRILERKTEVIVDFLGNETFSKSEIGALFPPGGFVLIPSQVKEGQRLFRPIVEKLFMFADKYKDGFNKLKGEIIVTGYSDASPVEPGTHLYNVLASHLQREDNVNAPTSNDLNQKLSQLRAKAVKGLLESVIRIRKERSKTPLDIAITVLGRGEEIPRGLDTTIARDDRRRRVVTFYWVVLPDL